MKHHYAFLLSVLAAISVRAQNLVPNPSFEDVTQCPTGFSQLEYAAPWLDFRASPDVFNGCAASSFGVPNNIFGTRTAASGQAYAGMYNYYSALTNRREYFGVQLIEPLVPGVPTYVSFKVAASGGGGETWVMTYWIDRIGAKFSMDAWYEDKPTMTISNEADVYHDEVITYSTSWTTVMGIFIPDSAYTHVVLGNFFSDAQTTVQPTNWPGANTPGGYYYIDDVCVSQDAGETCDVTSAVQDRTMPALSAWYDANAQSIRVAARGEGGRRILLFDAAGRPIREARTNGDGSQTLVPVSDLASGIYLVRCDRAAVVRVLVP